MDGAAGPSGLDAAAWKRLCTSFKSASTELCDTLAAVARRLSTCFVDPSGLSAFVACRLIALDKCPGVRASRNAIRHKFLPSLTGQSALNDETRDLMALPVRHGGLGVINPTRNTRSHHQSSESITAPLVSLIVEQSHTYDQEAKVEQLRAKKEAITQHKQLDSAAAAELEDKLPNNLKRAIQVSKEKGASSWLATPPPPPPPPPHS